MTDELKRGDKVFDIGDPERKPMTVLSDSNYPGQAIKVMKQNGLKDHILIGNLVKF